MTKASRFAFVAVFSFFSATGAGEAGARVIHVDSASVTHGNPDGTTWHKAFPTVQQGVNAAVAGDEVWVAAGVQAYVENVALKDGVAVYGGFDTAETLRDQRDWLANPTVLDGGGAASVVSVVSCPSATTRLDGFRIQDGYSQFGGGVYVRDSNPVIANNEIRGNTATGLGGNGSMYGAGIAAFYSSPRIIGNTIAGNTYEPSTMTNTLYGGGIYLESSAGTIVEENAFLDNSARYGGGIFVYSSNSVSISGNSFVANHAYEGGALSSYWSNTVVSGNTMTSNTATIGGGVYTWGTPAALFISNVFRLNAASQGGGGALANTMTYFSSNVFAQNQSTNGGGIFVARTSAASNNTFVGNTATNNGGAVFVSAAGCDLKNNIFSFSDSGVFVDTARGAAATSVANLYFGNSLYDASGIAAGPGDVLADPLFADLPGGDYHLTAGSPAFDAGDSTAVLSADWVDIDGEARVNAAAVDIGADELHVDTTGPTVVTTAPANGETGVALSTAVTVVFSEDIVLGSTPQNIALFDVARGTLVPCSVTVAGRNLTLTPDALLTRLTSYQATAGASSVTDATGNPLAVDVTVSFTTGKR